MTEFDLSAAVRDVHHATDLTDHRQVAKEVRARIPDDHLEAALLEALITYVRNLFSLERNHAGMPGNKSAKRESIREWWRYQLNQRYGTTDGQKLLRRFTVDDCAFQAEQARKKATELEVKARKWDELGALLELNNASTVGELP